MAIIDEEKLRSSFKKVKEELDSLKNEIKALDSRIIEVLTKLEQNKKTTKNKPFFDISTGNKGVINHHQPSSTIINDNNQSIKTIKEELNNRFKRLSDREFSIFLAIYTLEEELGRQIRLGDLSERLKISEITIRGYVNTIISKKIPIIKERPFNKKILLSIDKEFRDLALVSKLLSIRNPRNNQKTLFDT